MTTAAAYENNNSRMVAGVIAGIYTAAVILFILLFKLVQTWPPENLDEGGLAVDFGYTEVGLGTIEPEGNVAYQSSPEKSSSSASDKSDDITSDAEETVSVPSNPVKTKSPIATINFPEVKPKTTTTNSNSQPAVNDNALFPGKKNGSGNGNEGNTPGDGNMGVPNGTESENYKGTPTGWGNDGVGIGKGLAGRKLESIPAIVDNSDIVGIIVVKVTVNKSGAVTKAEYSSIGSTISVQSLITKSINAAKLARFTPSPDKDFDSGTLVFSYKVQ